MFPMVRALRSFAIVAALVLPNYALAGPVTFQIVQEVNPDVTFSVIHSAEGNPVNPLYYSSGEAYLQINGQLTGDLTGGLLTLDPVTLNLTIISAVVPAAVWTLDILAGSLTDVGGGTAEGTIDYVLRRDGAVDETGTFYLDPILFGGGPNISNGSEIAIWGNNWAANPAFHAATMTREQFAATGSTPLAIDLRALLVPEPAMAWLMMVAAASCVRRRRHPVV